MRIDGKQTYWDGEPCPVRRVRVIVGEPLQPTWWCASLAGQERVVLEVQASWGDLFYIDDDVQAHSKLTDGLGMWTHGHRGVPVAEVLEVLDETAQAWAGPGLSNDQGGEGEGA